jgi:hypothetical protein
LLPVVELARAKDALGLHALATEIEQQSHRQVGRCPIGDDLSYLFVGQYVRHSLTFDQDHSIDQMVEVEEAVHPVAHHDLNLFLGFNRQAKGEHLVSEHVLVDLLLVAGPDLVMHGEGCTDDFVGNIAIGCILSQRHAFPA